MNRPKISIIAAIGKNKELGKDNKLLWHIPGELPRFKKITTGHPIIMGRKTFGSIGRPLPNRTNIVVTRDESYKAKGVLVAHSIEEAIEKAKENPSEGGDSSEIFVIGGGQIYKQALPLADKLYLTLVEGEYEADTFFPDYSQFKKVVYEEKKESEGLKYKFLELER
ncbi:MAG: diacylglycerol kinase [Candidatus Woykebacteria bacterium RBG_16_43_9]|uniref:Dihydrofolate reductase n=1 Tax=Candidatus Woykebacteria bacterium RBG_16_43_9 TaxID=1802596 RepID=A0A1G1WDQ9_9BACT|nr:MAG: diacylglycerol kinase [Candidatus Woykebacteria bacterium RBG_16_43_9]